MLKIHFPWSEFRRLFKNNRVFVMIFDTSGFILRQISFIFFMRPAKNPLTGSMEMFHLKIIKNSMKIHLNFLYKDSWMELQENDLKNSIKLLSSI